LVVAYVIDDLSKPPSATAIWYFSLGAAGCFGLAMLLALVVICLK
jgi:hypothetical protein